MSGRNLCHVVFCLLALCILTACGCSRDVGKLDRHDRANPLMKRAEARANEGEVDSAIDLYCKAIETDPANARAHLDLAILLHDSKKDYVGAIYHYRRYLNLRPDTEKKDMIKDRLRLAERLFAGTVLDPKNYDSDDIAEAMKQNRILKEEVDRLEAELEEVRRRNARSEESSPESTRAPQVLRTYKVKRGDSLSSIAFDLYDDPTKADMIYEVNRDSIDNPDRLKVGQVLVVP